MAKFNVYKLGNEVFTITMLDGKPFVEFGISPTVCEPFDTFEADGKGDYNWGIVSAYEKLDADGLVLQTKDAKRARQIARDGL